MDRPTDPPRGPALTLRHLSTSHRQNAKSIPDRPSVYVYTLPSNLSGTWLYQNLTGNDHDFHFAGEYVFWQRLLHNYPQASPDVSAPVAMKPRHTTL